MQSMSIKILKILFKSFFIYFNDTGGGRPLEFTQLAQRPLLSS
jgi:hypothetical protein